VSDCIAIMRGHVWLPHYSEGLSGHAATSMAGHGVRRFRLHLAAPAPSQPPIEAVFALEFQANTTARASSLAYAWTPCAGFALPRMYGMVSSRRLGPLTRLVVTAQYAYGGDPAGRLFHDAVGKRLARACFKKLTAILKRIVLEAASAPLVAAEDPDLPSAHRPSPR
jgi:hypothetical protein